MKRARHSGGHHAGLFGCQHRERRGSGFAEKPSHGGPVGIEHSCCMDFTGRRSRSPDFPQMSLTPIHRLVDGPGVSNILARGIQLLTQCRVRASETKHNVYLLTLA